MPAVSKKQRRFFGAELSRRREGKETRTNLSEEALKDFAKTPEKNLPLKKKLAKRNQ